MVTNKKTDVPSESPREKIISDLATQTIDLKLIMDNKEINWFFYEGYEGRALKKALYTAEKYLIKRKIDDKSPLGKEVADRIVDAWGCRCLVDEAMSTVLGHYGISCSDQLVYRTFAYKIMRIVKDYHLKEWEKRILDALDEWKRKHRVDERVLHTVALTTAKITAEYFHGSRWKDMRYMRLPRPIEEETKVPEDKSVITEGEGERSGST